MFQKFIGDKLQQQEGQGAKALEAQYQAEKLKIIRKVPMSYMLATRIMPCAHTHTQTYTLVVFHKSQRDHRNRQVLLGNHWSW